MSHDFGASAVAVMFAITIRLIAALVLFIARTDDSARGLPNSSAILRALVYGNLFANRISTSTLGPAIRLFSFAYLIVATQLGMFSEAGVTEAVILTLTILASAFPICRRRSGVRSSSVVIRSDCACGLHCH